jgi:hypothetical protein
MEHPSMNERIKELALVNERIQNFFETGPVQRAAIEEFAQLIVNECMFQCNINQAGNTGISKDFSEGHIMGVYECFHKIKNHFGVEETE